MALERFLVLAVLILAVIASLVTKSSCKNTAEETGDDVSTSIDLEALYDTERTPSRDRRDADHDTILQSSSSEEIGERKKRGSRLRRRPKKKVNKKRRRSRGSRKPSSGGSGGGNSNVPVAGGLEALASGLDVVSSGMDLANTLQENNADNLYDGADYN